MGMLETWTQIQSFLSESLNDDLILQMVPVHIGEKIHPSQNLPSILFIHNIAKRKTYYYGFDHPDVKLVENRDDELFIKSINNLSGKKWVFDKKSFIQLFPLKDLNDVCLLEYIETSKVLNLEEYETGAHKIIRRRVREFQNINKSIPLMKHLEMFNELVESCVKIINRYHTDEAYDKFNNGIIEPLSELEKNGIAIDRIIFRKFFHSISEDMVYTHYNLYTRTGRPSNTFNNVNYAALNKENGCRRAFISRFGNKKGKLILIDYSAFHPHIIALLTGYKLPKFMDVYYYLAKLYFNKDNPDELDVADAKQITFRQLYGGVETKYKHIKYLSQLKEFIDYQFNLFYKNGYVNTPLFGRKITNNHITSSKPATIFNYILQAVEGEIILPVLGEVNKLLYNKKTKAILYTYDSLLFDYCIEDGLELINDIKTIMSVGNKFPMKCYIGDNYHDMELVGEI